MELYKAIENLKFDTRLLQRNLQNGVLPAEEWDRHLKGLKDYKDQVLQVSLESVDDDIDHMNGDYNQN